MTYASARPENQPFTACPNGRYDGGRSRPHNFVGFAPDDGGEPLIFCARCGETRALRPHPVERVYRGEAASGSVGVDEP